MGENGLSPAQLLWLAAIPTLKRHLQIAPYQSPFPEPFSLVLLSAQKHYIQR